VQLLYAFELLLGLLLELVVKENIVAHQPLANGVDLLPLVLNKTGIILDPVVGHIVGVQGVVLNPLQVFKLELPFLLLDGLQHLELLVVHLAEPFVGHQFGEEALVAPRFQQIKDHVLHKGPFEHGVVFVAGALVEILILHRRLRQVIELVHVLVQLSFLQFVILF